jgi:hypothetical protein
MGRFAAAGIGAVLACALVASGCGGDGRLTRAELVGRADAICHREDVATERCTSQPPVDWPT